MERERVRVAITFCSIALAGLAFASNARAQCTRETLQKLADAYVKAQTAGNAAMLPLAAGASYAENDKAMDIAKGVLAGPLKVDFTRSLYDTTQCAAFTELVAATDPHPYVIHTRMEATQKGQVSKMESVVTDAGDWVFGATEHLAVTRSEKWDEIPKDRRDTRAAIQAAADAYLNNWGNPELPVPHGTPCSRLEGLMSTSLTKTSAPLSSSTTSPGSMPVCQPTREPRPAKCSGLRAARIATSTRSRFARRKAVEERAGGDEVDGDKADNRAKADEGAKVANRDQAHRSNRQGAGGA